MPFNRNLVIKPLIVVIDDDENIQSLARSVLRMKYDVLSAHDGLSGIDLLKTRAPSLIFLDINMPGMDGLDTLKEILKIIPNTKVVMFSRKSSEENIKEAMKIGAKGFVTKPFTADTLLQYAEKIMGHC